MPDNQCGGAQDGSNQVKKMMDLKILDINLEKSVYLLLERKKMVKKIRKEIENLPI